MKVLKIDSIKTEELRKIVDGLLNEEEKEQLKDFSFYAVDRLQGRCFYDEKVITVPTMCWSGGFVPRGKVKFCGGVEFITYYVAHEITHAFVGRAAGHGPEFMTRFRALCPVHLQHFELLYKPRNAKLAGIEEV